MADTTRKIDVVVGYRSTGAASVTADVAKLRSELNLPMMGPLGRSDQLLQNAAVQKIRQMEGAGDRSQVAQRLQESFFGPDDGELRSRQAVQARIWRSDAQKKMETERDREFNSGESRQELATRMRGGESPRAANEARLAALAEKEASLKERSLFQQERAFARFFKSLAATAIVDVVGRKLEQLPAAVDEFYKDVRYGGSKVEAWGNLLANSVPGAGELAKGLRGVKQTLREEISGVFGYSGYQHEGDMRRKYEEVRADEAAKKMEQARINAVREPIYLAANARNRELMAAQNLNGTLGLTREQGEASNAREARDYETNKRAARERVLIDPRLQEQYDAQTKAELKQSETQYWEDIRAIDKRWNAQLESTARQHADKLEQIEDSRHSTLLEMDGRFYTARLEAVKSAAADRAREILRQRADEKKDPDVDQDASQIAASKALIANAEDRAAKLKQLGHNENRDRLEDLYDYQQREFDAHSSQRERLSRLMGDHYSADKEQLSRQRSDRLSEIDKEEREKIAAHGERADEYRKRAADQRGDANADFAISDAEMQLRLGKAFRVNPSNTTPMGDNRMLTGSGSAFKQGTGTDEKMLAKLNEILVQLKNGPVLQMPPNSY